MLQFNSLSGIGSSFHLLPLKSEDLKNKALTLRFVSGIWTASSCGACLAHWLPTLTLAGRELPLPAYMFRYARKSVFTGTEYLFSAVLHVK